MERSTRALLLGCAIALIASRADAYRPFDGTDADVAELGSFELELGPAHFYDDNGQSSLIAPATVPVTSFDQSDAQLFLRGFLHAG